MKVSFTKKFWEGLKKFDLKHDDFPTMMGNVGILLRILTINIFKRQTKSKYLETYLCIPKLNISYISMLIFICIMFEKKFNKRICIIKSCINTCKTKIEPVKRMFTFV